MLTFENWHSQIKIGQNIGICEPNRFRSAFCIIKFMPRVKNLVSVPTLAPGKYFKPGTLSAPQHKPLLYPSGNPPLLLSIQYSVPSTMYECCKYPFYEPCRPPWTPPTPSPTSKASLLCAVQTSGTTNLKWLHYACITNTSIYFSIGLIMFYNCITIRALCSLINKHNKCKLNGYNVPVFLYS